MIHVDTGKPLTAVEKRAVIGECSKEVTKRVLQYAARVVVTKVNPTYGEHALLKAAVSFMTLAAMTALATFIAFGPGSAYESWLNSAMVVSAVSILVADNVYKTRALARVSEWTREKL